MASVFFKGADKIRKNLLAQEKEMQTKAIAGLIDGAIIVRRAMEHQMPVTPLDLGNLRASFFIVVPKSKKKQTSRMQPERLKDEAGNKTRFRGKVGEQVARDTERAVANAKARVAAARKITLIMGYGANYAVWVHEMPPGTNWSRQGSGPKWFETALKTNKAAILTAIGVKAKMYGIKGFTETKTTRAHTEFMDINKSTGVDTESASANK